MTCAHCTSEAIVRAGWHVPGAGWTEGDFCQSCMAAIHERKRSNDTTPYTLGPAGAPLNVPVESLGRAS